MPSLDQDSAVFYQYYANNSHAYKLKVMLSISVFSKFSQSILLGEILAGISYVVLLGCHLNQKCWDN